MNEPGREEHPTELIQGALRFAAQGDFERARRVLGRGCQEAPAGRVEVLRAALDPFRVDPAAWLVAGVTAAALAAIIGLNLFRV